jgi:Mg-chelatase subunit ChlD
MVLAYLGWLERYGAQLALGVLGVSLASGSAACGPPREQAYEFDEKTCGNLEKVRDPNPTPEARTARIRGHAERVGDDTVAITLAPLIRVEANAVVDWTASSVAVTGSATGSLACDLTLVGDSQQPEAVDVVFVLDTTGSMFWAIDGVKRGIRAFLDTLEAFNIGARVGGIEFGDEIRTKVPLGELDAFREWLDHMTATGGGDTPESPLDAMQEANSFSYRVDALRYMIVITDTGAHESTDATDCSETTLSVTQSVIDERTFVAVVHPNLGSARGVHPQEITRALGGLFVALGASSLISFDIAADTPADDVLASIAVLSCSGVGSSDSVDVETTVDNEPVTTTLAVQ